MGNKHDLTTAEGTFGYFAEHTEIMQPIKKAFLSLKEENEALKTELKCSRNKQNEITPSTGIYTLYLVELCIYCGCSILVISSHTP